MFAHPLGGTFVFYFGLFGGSVHIDSSGVDSVFRFDFRPKFADLFFGLLAGVAVFDLQHGDEFIELHFGFVHFDEIIFDHQTPFGIDLPADQLPIFFELCFIHDALLLGAALFRLMRIGSFAMSFPFVSPMNRRDKIFKLLRQIIVLRQSGNKGNALELKRPRRHEDLQPQVRAEVFQPRIRERRHDRFAFMFPNL